MISINCASLGMHPDFCNRSKVSAFSVKDSIVFANFSLVFFDTTQICAKKPWMTPMSQSKFFVCVSKDLNPVLLAFCSNKARYSSSSESSSSLPPSLLSSFVDLSLFFSSSRRLRPCPSFSVGFGRATFPFGKHFRCHRLVAQQVGDEISNFFVRYGR